MAGVRVEKVDEFMFLIVYTECPPRVNANALPKERRPICFSATTYLYDSLAVVARN